jgi:hypothetical protein
MEPACGGDRVPRPGVSGSSAEGRQPFSWIVPKMARVTVFAGEERVPRDRRLGWRAIFRLVEADDEAAQDFVGQAQLTV